MYRGERKLLALTVVGREFCQTDRVLTSLCVSTTFNSTHCEIQIGLPQHSISSEFVFNFKSIKTKEKKQARTKRCFCCYCIFTQNLSFYVPYAVGQ